MSDTYDEEQILAMMGHRLDSRDFDLLAQRYFKSTARCAGGRVVLAMGECDHCKSMSPYRICNDPHKDAVTRLMTKLEVDYNLEEAKERATKPKMRFRVIARQSTGRLRDVWMLTVDAIDARDAGRLAMKEFAIQDDQINSRVTSGELQIIVEKIA